MLIELSDDRPAWDKLLFSIGQFWKERRLGLRWLLLAHGMICSGCRANELSFTSWM